jgi:hypothetical protein
MINIATMFTSVLSLLLVCSLCVVGFIEPAGSYSGQPVFEPVDKSSLFGFALGGLIVSHPLTIKHEYGHYLQEQELKHWYLPIVGGFSLYGNLFLEHDDYYALPTERQANILGDNIWR